MLQLGETHVRKGSRCKSQGKEKGGEDMIRLMKTDRMPRKKHTSSRKGKKTWISKVWGECQLVDSGGTELDTWGGAVPPNLKGIRRPNRRLATPSGYDPLGRRLGRPKDIFFVHCGPTVRWKKR